eukprot:IDg20509t1
MNAKQLCRLIHFYWTWQFWEFTACISIRFLPEFLLSSQNCFAMEAEDTAPLILTTSRTRSYADARRSAFLTECNNIACSNSIELYETEHLTSPKGKSSVQNNIALAFLGRFTEIHDFLCPRGRVYEYYEPLRYLLSGTFTKEVYCSYKDMRNSLKYAAVGNDLRATLLTHPIVYKSFTRV